MHVSIPIKQTLETLQCLTIRQPEPTRSEGSSCKNLKPPVFEHPCRTEWQQKILRLEIVDPRIQVVADRVEDLARLFAFWPKPSLRGKWNTLVLAGDTGIGKTHAARALYRWAQANAISLWEKGNWPRPPSSTFVSWPEVCDQMKEGHYGILTDILEADLLIIDDLGAEHDPSKNGTAKLCQILSRREKRFNIFTTNIPPEKWPDEFDGRIADRLLRRSQCLNLFGLTTYSAR